MSMTPEEKRNPYPMFIMDKDMKVPSRSFEIWEEGYRAAQLAKADKSLEELEAKIAKSNAVGMGLIESDKPVCPECGDSKWVHSEQVGPEFKGGDVPCPICQGRDPKLDRNVASRCYGCGKEYKRHIVTGKTPLCPKCQLAENKAKAKLHGMTF